MLKAMLNESAYLSEPIRRAIDAQQQDPFRCHKIRASEFRRPSDDFSLTFNNRIYEEQHSRLTNYPRDISLRLWFARHLPSYCSSAHHSNAVRFVPLKVIIFAGLRACARCRPAKKFRSLNLDTQIQRRAYHPR